jgi:hypothetical protein
MGPKVFTAKSVAASVLFFLLTVLVLGVSARALPGVVPAAAKAALAPTAPAKPAASATSAAERPAKPARPPLKGVVAAKPTDYYTVTPCRVFNSRAGGSGGVFLGGTNAGNPRTIMVAGTCGVPATAKVVVLNVAVADFTSGGYVSLYPGPTPPPSHAGAFTFSYDPADPYPAKSDFVQATILATDGSITAEVLIPGGTSLNLFLDVYGYYDTAGPVVTAGGGGTPPTFTEGGGPVVVDPLISVADVASTTLSSATVTITNPQDGAAEVLAASNCAGLTVTPGLNSLSITGVKPILPDYQNCLRSVTYDNSSQNPGTTRRNIDFTVNDGVTASAPLTEHVDVAGLDDPPVAVDDTATVAEDDPATPITVLANDTDVDAGPISIASVTQPANGSVVITGGGTGLTYQPNPNYCNAPPGTTLDTFTYTLAPAGPTPTATVSVTVTCVDDAPVAVDDAAAVTEDDPATAINVLANDTDIDGGPKSIGSVTQPANGSVVITGGGTGLTYQPNPNYCNTPPGTALDTFTYTLAQGGPTPTATVSVTVSCVDDAPVAVADAATVAEDDPATAVNVLANDTDIDGGPKSIGSVTQPANGSVVITGGGTGLTYQPNPNYCNTPPGTTLDTFTYTLAQGGATPTATVSMTVTCVDDAPVAVADTATVTEDDPATAIPVLANDTDIDGGPKTIASVTQPANGSVVITGGGTGLTYQPNANYCEIKVSTAAQYRLGESDSGASSGNTGNNPTTALGGGPNLPRIGSPVYTSTVPAAITSSLAMSFNGTSDAYAASTLASTAVNNFGIEAWVRSNGSVTGNAVLAYNGSTAASGWGLYRIGGNYGFSYGGVVTTGVAPVVSGVWTHLALVRQSGTTTFYVNGYAAATSAAVPNTPATASSGGMMIGGNLAGTQFFDGAIDEVRIFTFTAGQFSPSDLTLSGSPTRTSPDTFTYTLAQGGATPTATVSVTATCVDDPPAAVADAATVVQSAPATAVDVLINDTDVDGGPRSIGSVTQPANGTVVITGGGTGLTYQPNAGYCNTPPGTSPDTFTYTLAQGGASPTATVSMSVTCDTPPTAVADALTVTEDAAATTVNVLANDTDPDGGPKSIASVTQPANGVVVITGGGTGLTYQPNANYCNNPPGTTLDTFTYTLTPGSSTATVTMTVSCVDDPPTAVADAATVAEDSGATAVNVLANDTDIDAGPKSIASVTQPANGVVVITGGGTGLTYAPNANYCNNPPGTTLDTFTYTLAPAGPTPTATVTMTVTCVDDAPVAVNDSATVTEDAPATAINVLANDTDVDGGPKSIASFTPPANGVVQITGGGTGLTYQPNADYCNNPPGTTLDTFTYTLTPAGPTPTATVTVTVTCVNDPPTDIVLSKSDVDENQPINTVVGTFSTTDPDVGDPHTYTLVGGAGSTDNGSFNISGNQLRTSAVFNFEVKNSYSIRVRTTDSGGLFFEKIFTITVNDLPEAPIASNDTYDTIGNTELRVDLAAGATPNVAVTSPGTPPNRGVLDNDSDDDAGQTNTLTVSGIVGCADSSAPFGDGPACGTANGGTVLMQNDGSFSYFPKAGDTAASDSFQYTARDTTSLTATGTVTINRKERVWYVKNDALAGGQGRSNDPFNTLVAAQTASSANDYIFVYLGDGTNTGQAAGIVLKNGQHLLGEHAGLTVAVPGAGTFNGTPLPTTVNLVTAVPGNRPLIDKSGAGNNAIAATDVVPVEIVGLSLSGGANAIDLTTGVALPASASLLIKDNIVRSAGAEGMDISLNAGTSGTLTLDVQGNSWTTTAASHVGNAFDARTAAAGAALRLAFRNNTSITSSATGVFIDGSGGGTITITDFANNTVSGNTLGSGIMVTTATFDQTPGGTFQTVSGGTTVVGAPGNGVNASGIALTGVSGDLLFNDLQVFADGGAGLRVVGTGAFASSTGMQIAVSNGGLSRSIAAVNGPAVDVTSATVSLPLAQITSSNSATTGVNLDTVGGTFSAGSGSSITNATGTDFSINAGNAAVTYDGTITDTTGRLVSVTSATGGTKSFTGAISDTGSGTGTGIFLNSNAGATINFSGTLTLSTGSSATAAFTATGAGPAATSGGTVTASNANSTIVTTTGTAVNVTNTTIGASGLKFKSITAGTGAAGPTNGIVLNNTGASGGLTVAGTGAAGSGGTIQKTTGASVSLTSTMGVGLSFMNIQNSAAEGILGTSVNGFSLTSCSVTGNGAPVGTNKNGIKLIDTTNAVTFTNDTVTGNFNSNVQLTTGGASAAAMTTLTVTNGTYSNSTQNAGFLVDLHGTASLATALVSGATFSGNFSKGIQFQHNDNATMGNGVGAPATGTITVNNCTFTNNDVAASFESGGNGNGSAYYRFTNNATITGSHSVAVNFANGSTVGTGTFKAFCDNNHIGTAGVPNSGSAIGEGIRVFMQGSQTATATITNNVIRALYNGAGGFDARGIDVEELGNSNANQGQTALDVKITGNDVDQQYTGSSFNIQYAIYVAADGQGTGTSGSNIKAEIHGNTVPAQSACDDSPCTGSGMSMIWYETVNATGTRAAALYNAFGDATVNAAIINRNTGTAGATQATQNSPAVTLTATPPNTVN